MNIPVLYILMRTDLASMNPGKACAQASHASNAFVEYMKGTMCEIDQGLECESQCNRWQGFENEDGTYNSNGLGFGTVIVLGATGDEMYEVVSYAQRLSVHAGVVNDPTYPLRDGQVTHVFPLDTCAWVFFVDKDDIRNSMILGHLDLHP